MNRHGMSLNGWRGCLAKTDISELVQNSIERQEHRGYPKMIPPNLGP